MKIHSSNKQPLFTQTNTSEEEQENSNTTHIRKVAESAIANQTNDSQVHSKQRICCCYVNISEENLIRGCKAVFAICALGIMLIVKHHMPD